MAANWQGGDDFSFGPSFWDAVRRLRAEHRYRKYPAQGFWVPTDDVWPYREYDRHEDTNYRFGGSKDTVENVDDIKQSMRRSGQFQPGLLLYDPDAVDMADQGLFGMHLGEGNHRLAAARQLKRPYYLVDFQRSSRKPNAEGGKPPGTHRGVIAKKTLRPNQFGHVSSLADPDDFEQFAGKGMEAADAVGSPDDRAIVKAMGNKEAAKRILKAMGKAGRVLAPIAGAVGVLAGLQDPAEAMGMTVDKTEGNRWANKQRTAKMKAKEKKYYADKQAKAEKVNPMAKYGTHGSARKKGK